MTNKKLEELPTLTLADSTLIYAEESPYTVLGNAGKFLLSSLDGRYNALYVKIAGDTMTGNLNMDDNNITNIEQAAFNLTPVATAGIGQLQWNNTDGTLEIGLLGDEVVLQIGQESHVYAVQMTGAAIPNGKTVLSIGTSGNRIEVALTDVNTAGRIGSLGLTTESIANNQQGYVTTFGLVRDVDTSAFAEGALLYADGTTPGDLTDTPPTAPVSKVFVGAVVRSHAVLGSIFVSPVSVQVLSSLSDVYAPSPSDGDYLRWNTVNARWELSAT